MSGSPSLRERAVHGAMWSLAERWLVRLLTLALLVVLGRLLGPEEFGLVAGASVVVDFVAIFVATGVSSYLVQAEEIDESQKTTALLVAGGSGLVFALMLVLVAPWVALGLGDESLRPLIQVLSLGLFVGSLAGVPEALILRQLGFRQLFIRSVTATIVSGGVAIALALEGAGAWSLVAQTVIYSAVRTVSVWSATRWRPRMAFSRSHAWEIIRFSRNMIGISLMAFVRNRGEIVLISTLRDPVALGIWVIGRRIVNVVAELFAGVVTRVATPVFARTKTDPERLFRGYTSSVLTVAALASPVLFVLAATAPVGVPLLFGPAWEEAGVITSLMALGFVPATTSYLNRGLFLALNRTGLELRFMIFTAATQVAVAAVVLLLGGSLVQLAAALAAREAVSWPVRLWTVRRALGRSMGPLVVELFRVWAAAACAGGVAWGVMMVTASWPEWPSVLTAAGAGMLVFIPTLWLAHRRVFSDVMRIFRTATRRHPRATRATDDDSEEAMR